MTFTSSPGFSLMLEGLSYMIGAEVPGVVVDVMRGGPGLGNIGPEQGDVKLACRGLGHGNTHAVVLAPSTPQEMLDLTFVAFELAMKYRNPVVVLADGYLGQMTGRVSLPSAMVKPGIPPWAVYGDRAHRANLVSSIHLSEADLEAHNARLNEKYERMAGAEQRADLFLADDAEVIVVAANTPARMAKGAVRGLRERGVRAGLVRPLTLWPFPIRHLAPLLRRGVQLLVVEASEGQLEDELRLALSHGGFRLPPIDHLRHQGGVLPTAARSWSACWTSHGRRRPWHERHLRAVRASRSRPGPEGPEHALLPGVRPRAGAQVPGRRDRRAGRPGPHGGHLARRVRGVPPLLPRRGEHPGRPRTGARGRHRPQARQPRRDRGQLPGRRRPGLDRSGRDRPGRPARTAAHRRLREQRHLRDDRRPDGAHDTPRPEDRHQPLRARPARGRAAADGRAHRADRRRRLRRARGALRRPAAREGAEGDPPCARDPGLQPGLRFRRGSLGVPAAPGPEPAGRREVGPGEHGPGLPAGGEEGPGRGALARVEAAAVRPGAPERPPGRHGRSPAPLRPVLCGHPFGEDVGLKLAGAGGDGAQTAAMLIARAAINEGFDATHIPSYGPESRGGTSYADVRIAPEEVLSPAVPNPRALVAFNAPSLVRFGPAVPRDTYLTAIRQALHDKPGLVPPNERAFVRGWEMARGTREAACRSC